MSGELELQDLRTTRTLILPPEVRDPRAATQRVGYSSPTLPQVDEWDANQAFRLGYLANVIAYRCTQLRAAAAASVPILAGRRAGDAANANPNAPIARLLGPPPGGPAPRLSARKLIRWTIGQHIVTGRRAWEIETDDGTADGVPVAFWPLASAHLRTQPSTSGNEWFRVFEYGNHWNPIRLQPDQVFYGWDPSGLDFRQAESPLQAARFDLSLVNLCDRYGIGFLRNNAVPSTVITVTQFPTEEAKRKFLANWENDFGGPDNAGRVALNEVGVDGDGPVGDSIDIKQIGLSAKDARLVETRRDALVEVAMALGTPWSKLDASGRTFDNAGQEDLDWWENTILPDLIDLQDDINMQLAPRLGDEVVWFDLRQVRALQRRVQPITQTVGAPSLVQAQLMKINEARADYGLDPDPDGDRFMTAEEIAALRGGGQVAGDPAIAARVAELEQRITQPAPPPCTCQTFDGTGDRCARCGGRAPERPIVLPAAVGRRDVDAVEERRARIWRASDAVVTALEGRWTRSMRRLFARQQEATLARLTGKRGRQALGQRAGDAAGNIDPAAVFDVDFWTTQTVEVAQDLVEEVAVAGLNRLASAFGVSFDVTAPWAKELIEGRAKQLAGQVTDTTYDAIRTQLTDGVAAGDTIDQLADRVRTVFQQANDSRAETIARTEVISAYNGSASIGAAQLPDVVAGQEWIATRDSRTRASHAELDGQTQPIGTAFSNGLAYPGDPSGPGSETVNCRCTIAFLTPDEMAAAGGRSSLRVEVRHAVAMLRLVDDTTDLLAWRRALEETAA